ncbi:MAG: (Fe-S)-binding protein [Deltaproteobacteria bacterium]|nr:(Fe-S)-binding protein [Deltaproteobacteria bacterium]
MFQSELLSASLAFEDAAVATCEACPRLCRHACPVAEVDGRESTSPHALVTLSGLLKRARIRAESVAPFIYHCTDCGACTSACLHKNDVPRIVTLARHRLLLERSAPAEVKELCGRFGVAGNPQGRSLRDALDQVSEVSGRPIVSEAPTIYLPGCMTLDRSPQSAIDFLRATSLLGVFGVELARSSDACCGLPLYWAGDLEGFRQHARRIADQFAHVERLIVHDPACALAMRVRYAEVGVHLRARVEHVVPFLAEAFGAEASTPREGATPSWHGVLAIADNCAASRGLELGQTLRSLVRRVSGCEPQEITTLSDREADCCGAGGLLPLTTPILAHEMAMARIETFRTSGGDTLVMPSPRCVAHLREVDPTVNVLDLASLVGRV